MKIGSTFIFWLAICFTNPSYGDGNCYEYTSLMATAKSAARSPLTPKFIGSLSLGIIFAILVDSQGGEFISPDDRLYMERVAAEDEKERLETASREKTNPMHGLVGRIEIPPEKPRPRP